MGFSQFIAFRYLRPKRTFISVITFISILGVTLGVWLISVVIPVFNGYGSKLKDIVLSSEPHLIIKSDSRKIDNWPEIYKNLKEIQNAESKSSNTNPITSITPFVSGKVPVTITKNGETTQIAGLIQGILPPEKEELKRLNGKMYKTHNRNIKNIFDISDLESGIIGRVMAERNGLEIGDKITIHSSGIISYAMSLFGKNKEEILKEINSKFDSLVSPQEIIIKGIFNSSNYDFDSSVIFLNIETAQILSKLEPYESDGIALRYKDGMKAAQERNKLMKLLPKNLYIHTWMSQHQAIFNAIAIERQMMYLILFMILIVSGFCIMNTMITVASQKQSEIGLMKALGAKDLQIALIFLIKSLIISFVGLILGLLLAQLTIYFRNDIANYVGENFGVDFFNEEVYKIDGGIPAKQTLKDFIIISIGSVFICALSSIFPAYISFYFQPAKSLRSK